MNEGPGHGPQRDDVRPHPALSHGERASGGSRFVGMRPAIHNAKPRMRLGAR